MLNKIDISIICCHHRGNFIHNFVKSVRNSTLLENYEIIIMTSDSILATTGIKDCTTIYYEGMPAAKRNAGARIAKGELLAFFDDDVEIEPYCLEELRYALYLPNAGMVYGKLWNMEHRNRFDEAGSFLTWTGFLWSRAEQNAVDNGQFDNSECILAGKSASCMILKKVFDKIGGFDEDFEILGEETDLSWRVWLAGYRVYFAPKATGFHAFNTIYKPAKEYYTSKRVHYNGCRNYATMLIKNLESQNLLLILPVHLVVWFFAGLAMIITLRIPQGINIFRGLGHLIRNLKAILEKRRRIQEKRVIGDKALFTFILRQPHGTYYFQRFWRYIRTALHG